MRTTLMVLALAWPAIAADPKIEPLDGGVLRISARSQLYAKSAQEKAEDIAAYEELARLALEEADRLRNA